MREVGRELEALRFEQLARQKREREQQNEGLRQGPRALLSPPGRVPGS